MSNEVRMLRVLLVEDSADDAELLRLELEESGMQVNMLQVSSECALREAMQGFKPDVAISDLNLPGYSGLLALQLLHELQPGLPLFLVSGDDHDTALVLPVPATVLHKSRLWQLPALLVAALHLTEPA